MIHEYLSRSRSGQLLCRRLNANDDLRFAVELFLDAQQQVTPSWVDKEERVVSRGEVAEQLIELFQKQKSIFYYKNFYGAFDWGNQHRPLGIMLVIDEQTPLDETGYPDYLQPLVKKLVIERQQLPPETLLLTSIYVQRSKRRQAIGGDLLWHFGSALNNTGYKSLYFICPNDSQGLQQLFYTQGYEQATPQGDWGPHYSAFTRKINQ